MKRVIVIAAVLALLFGLPMSHFAFAGKGPAAKVDICHVNSANDVLELEDGFVVTFGKVISVSENAVAAHEAHGDSTDFADLDQDLRDLVEELFGITLPNANCLFVPAP